MTDDPIDNWEIQFGGITYSVSVITNGDKFVATWRCPICETRQGCSRHTDTHMEAVECAEEDARAHQKEYHPKVYGMEFDNPSTCPRID